MRSTKPNLPGQIVLVLQGGGALGSYQAGVYQALHEAGVEPDWIIGTSIGAINAALIVGNEPENRLAKLREFWQRVEQRPFWTVPGLLPSVNDALSYWSTIANGLPNFFTLNPLSQLGAAYPLGPDRAGYYSTAPLRATLLDLVDFSLVNRCSPRLTVGAAHLRTSQMRYFDSRDADLGVDHITASGALPPAFSPVRIKGELYWDGGILSNTPTEAVFDDNPRKNSVIFAVHMWNPTGPEPETMPMCSTGKRTFNIQAGLQLTSRASSKPIVCATSFRSWSGSFRSMNAGRTPSESSPLTAVRPACTLCDYWHRCWSARTTPRISTSARPVFVSDGKQVTPTRKMFLSKGLGRAISIRSRVSFCMNGKKACSWQQNRRAARPEADGTRPQSGVPASSTS
jgi:predicted acylesterase/phospholipase RssA